MLPCLLSERLTVLRKTGIVFACTSTSGGVNKLCASALHTQLERTRKQMQSEFQFSVVVLLILKGR